LRDRGRIAEGFAADIVVFDPATVADHATYDQPTRPATGIEFVFVNGALALSHGRVTGVMAGRPIP
jgi:N-acyl-D-amino-acid deacylase